MTGSTEGRKPLTTAQLYSATHPKINGALCHKAIDCDVTQCHCLVIGTVRHGDNQMAKTLKTFTATDSTGLVYAKTTSADLAFCVVYAGADEPPTWVTDDVQARHVAAVKHRIAHGTRCHVSGCVVEVLDAQRIVALNALDLQVYTAQHVTDMVDIDVLLVRAEGHRRQDVAANEIIRLLGLLASARRAFAEAEKILVATFAAEDRA